MHTVQSAPTRPGRARRLAIGVAAAASFAAFSLATAPVASATFRSHLYLTLVARACPTYQSITANLLRNNIMESLQDLGADSAYYGFGDPVRPTVEDDFQNTCTPLPGWEFSLGPGYQTKAVSGYWGALSIVTGETRAPVETLPSVPLLNSAGRPSGGSIDGAVTIELNKQEEDLVEEADRLWVQGGTPSDPILSARYPNVYGFGALRCAIDNVNGDNVEWIGYPAGFYRHVFCYAYYVKLPPAAGKIVIRKKVVGGDTGAPETFSFGGNVSYNPGGRFALTVAPPATEAQLSFTREHVEAGGTPWHVNENVPASWKLKAIKCSSESGKSETTVNLAAQEASITVLAPDDTVTCTYEDEFVPPPGSLAVRKVSIGGTGRFGFRIQRAKPTLKDVAKFFANTLEEGVAVDGQGSPFELAPADYRVDETSSPTGDRGTWVETAAGCDNSRGMPKARRSS